MTFEWKRASRAIAVVPVSSFIDFCPEIQDGRGGVDHKQYKDQTDLWTAIPCKERFSQQTNADVIVEQTEDGNQHRLVV